MSPARQKRTRRFAAAADAGSFLGTFALLFAAIGGLFTVDTFLAGLERVEQRSQASHLFREGISFTHHGRTAEAIDRLNTAVSLERENPMYQHALAEAFLAAGKLSDAATVLTDRLQHDPADAAASLTMARVLVQEHKAREAVLYYHRAIFGQWRDDATRRRIHARFELIEQLVQQDAKRELLAELLPLQDEAPNDVSTRKRIARLFIVAGSPVRAVEVFRNVLRQNPRDADAYAGLGEAEFARRNYRTARNDFLAASRLKPDDEAITARLALCDQVLALDPLQRRLGADEVYRRSRHLTELALAAIENCAGPTRASLAQAVLDSARSALAQPTPTHQSSVRRQAAINAYLDVTERLEQVRRTTCPRSIGAEDPLSLVLEKLAQ